MSLNNLNSELLTSDIYKSYTVGVILLYSIFLIMNKLLMKIIIYFKGYNVTDTIDSVKKDMYKLISDSAKERLEHLIKKRKERKHG